ncbi:MAG TPA: hypothetical protein VHZ51_25970, partial [Ktedonobacteraceae bacterium]|nr:hypothetical protein [Ktedonobacteraceae bacterium]
LLILISCFRELWSMKPLLLIVGTIVGLLPLLIYDIHNPSQNAIITLLRLHSAGGVSQGATTYSHFNSILGTILISIPTMTGAVHLYPFSSDPGKWREQLSSHALFQGVWGTIFVIFLGIALVLTAYSLFKNRSISNANDATEKRTMQVRYMARLFLLGGAVLTLLSYMMSPAPAVVPVTSARYLVGLLIITPSLIALPYSLLSKYRNSQSFSWPAVLAVVGLGILSFIFMIYFYGTFTMFGQQISGVQKLNQQQSELVNGLERNHITRIYSDYWTCDRVIFQSDEHIICDVLRDNLRTGQNRYLPFRAVVMSSPHVAYVFTLHSPQDVLLHSRKFQQTFSFGGYHVYVP